MEVQLIGKRKVKTGNNYKKLKVKGQYSAKSIRHGL